MSNKLRDINILKGLGIIAVVLGHVGSPITNIIYMYHMSLFFFISGYLYKDSCEKNLGQYIIKKFKSLYIPFVVFELMFLALRNILIDLNIYNQSQTIRINGINDIILNLKSIITFNSTDNALLGAVWFLKALFYVSILYAIFNVVYKKVFKNENDYIKSLIILLLTVLSFDLIATGRNLGILLNPDGRKVLKIFTDLFDSRNLIIMSIFYMGTLYRKYKDKVPMNLYLMIICMVSMIYNGRMGGIDIAHYQFVGPIYFIINSLLGIYINLYIAYRMYNLRFNFFIVENAGEYSLYIMIFHLLVCKILDLVIINIYKLPVEFTSGYPVSFYNNYIWVIYTILGTIIPIIIAKLYSGICISIKQILNKDKYERSFDAQLN